MSESINNNIMMWDVMCKDVVGCRSDRAKVQKTIRSEARVA